MTAVKKIGIEVQVDASSVKAGMTAAGRDVEVFGNKVGQVSVQTSRDLNLIEKASQGVSAGMGLMARAAAPLAAALGAREFIQTADAVTALRTSLAQSTGTSSEAATAYTRLFGIAQQSRVEFTALGGTYATISRAGQELGVSQDRLLKVTQAIGNAMAIGGGSAQGMQAALVQLGQGLGSGVLRGDEFNSVMEQAPRLARAMADGLGVPLSALRALAQEGELTAEKVIGALEKAAPALARELGNATMTVGQAMTVVGNSATRLAGEVNEASNATGILAKGLKFASNDMDAVAEAMDRARQSGGGFFSQFNSGVGMVIGRALGLQVVSREFMTTDQAIADATATIAALDAKAAKGELFFYGMMKRVQAVLDLAAANERLAKSGGAAGNVTADIASQYSTRSQSIANFDKVQAKAAAELMEVRQRLSGVNASYLKDLQAYQTALKAGVIGEKQYIEEVSKLAAANVKKADSTKGAAKAERDANRERESQAKLLAELSGLTGSFAEDWDRLTKLYRAGALSLDQFTEAQAKLLAKQPAMTAAERTRLDNQKKLTEAKAELSKAAQAAGALIERDYAARVRENESLISGNDTLRAEIELIGLDETARGQRLVAREQEAVAMLEERLLRERNVEGNERAIQLLEEEIALRRQRAQLLGQKSVATVAAESAADAADEWKTFNADVQRGLTDSLYRGFEAGAKGGAEMFVKSVGNSLKTAGFKIGVDYVSSGVTGALGISQAAGAAGSASNAVSALSNFSTAGTIASLGSTLGNFTAGLSAGFSQFTAGVNTFASLSNAAAVGGSTGAGIGLAAAAPYLAAILAVIAIAKATKGETRGGGQYGYGTTGTGNYGLGSASYIAGPSGGEIESKAVKSAIDATVAGINATLQAVGSSATLTGFQAALETSGKGRGGVYAGGTLSTGATFGDLGSGGGRSNYNGTLYETTSSTSPDGAAALKAFTDDLLQSTIQALQAATDVPKRISDMLQGVDAESLSTEAASTLIANVTAMAEFARAADALPFANLRDLSFDAADSLVKLAGGMQGLSGALGAYYQNFYSDSERQTQAIKNLQAVFGDLDLTMPSLAQSGEDARAQFRALVDAQDLNTESGRRAYTTLLGVQGAFADLTPIGLDAVGTIDEVTGEVKALSDVMIELGREHASLQDEYDQLTLSQADYRAKAVAGYTAEERAAAAANHALADRIAALQAEAQATASLAADRASLEIELMRAQGDAAGALAAQRQLDITAMTAAQVAAYDHNQGLREGIAAAEAAAQQQQDLAQQMQQAADQARNLSASLADTGRALEIDLMRAQGDAAGALAAQRQLDIAGMTAAQVAQYDYNQSVRDSISAANAAGQAIAQAQAQAKATEQQRYNLETQLLQLIGDTTTLRERELALVDEGNRPMQQLIWARQAQMAADAAAAQAAEAAAQAQQQAAEQAAQAAQQLAQQAAQAAQQQAQQAAQAADAVASEGIGLYRRLLALQEDVSTLRALELQDLNAVNRPLQEQVWLIEDQTDALDKVTGAQSSYNDSLRDSAEFLVGIGRDVRAYFARVHASPDGLGSPASQVASARAEFERQFALAQGGDRDALQGITGYADQYINAQRGVATSAVDVQRLIGQLEGRLMTLPDQVRPEQMIVAAIEAQTGTTTAQAATLNTESIAAVMAENVRAIAAGRAEADRLVAAAQAQAAAITSHATSQAARTVTAINTTSTANLSALAANFEQLDATADGLLDAAELRAALGPVASDSVLRQVFATLDLDGDAQISRLEAIRATTSGLASSIALGLVPNFTRLDTSVNGLLDLTELRAALGPLATDSVLRGLMAIVDSDGDNMISRLEAIRASMSPVAGLLGNTLAGKFDALDRTVDGLLTLGELQAGLSGLASDDMLREVIANLDENADGQVSRLEAIKGNTAGLVTGIAQSLSGSFTRLDASLNGLLDLGELKAALGPLATDSVLRQVFATLDLDGDAQISRLEAIRGGVSGLASGVAASLRDSFDRIDATANGLLSADELRAALGPVASDFVLRQVFATLDTDGDGQISRLEAIKASTEGLADGIAHALAGSFEQLDSSLDGLLSADELRAALGPLASDSVLRQVFATLDTDGDGQISRLEAIKASTAQAAHETLQTAIRAQDLAAIKQATDASAANTATPIFASVFGNAINNGDLRNVTATLDTRLSEISVLAWRIDQWTGMTMARVIDIANGAVQVQVGGARLDAIAAETYYTALRTMSVAESAAAARSYVAAIWGGSPLRVYSANRDFGNGMQVFATGAAFTGQGVYSRPTMFGLGELGEAGPEGILPLANVGGKLGVLSTGGDNRELVAAVRELVDRAKRQERVSTAAMLHAERTVQMLTEVVEVGIPVRTLRGEVVAVAST